MSTPAQDLIIQNIKETVSALIPTICEQKLDIEDLSECFAHLDNRPQLTFFLSRYVLRIKMQLRLMLLIEDRLTRDNLHGVMAAIARITELNTVFNELISQKKISSRPDLGYRPVADHAASLT